MKYLIILMLFSIGCAKAKEVPVEEMYIANLVDNICTKYPVTDKEDFKFGEPVDIPLVKGGPCDRMVGVKFQDWKTLQNWIRDEIENSKKKNIPLEPY